MLNNKKFQSTKNNGYRKKNSSMINYKPLIINYPINHRNLMNNKNSIKIKFFKWIINYKNLKNKHNNYNNY